MRDQMSTALLHNPQEQSIATENCQSLPGLNSSFSRQHIPGPMETKEVEDGRQSSQVHHQGADTSAATSTTRQIKASHRLLVRPHALRILLEYGVLMPQLLLLWPMNCFSLVS